MPKEKQARLLCADDLRHAEYYMMQSVFDDLFDRSENNEQVILWM